MFGDINYCLLVGLALSSWFSLCIVNQQHLSFFEKISCCKNLETETETYPAHKTVSAKSSDLPQKLSTFLPELLIIAIVSNIVILVLYKFSNYVFSTLKFKLPYSCTNVNTVEPINKRTMNENLQNTINTLNSDIVLLQSKLDEAIKTNIGFSEKEKESIFKTMVYFKKMYKISKKPKLNATSNTCLMQPNSENRLIVRKLCREILGPIVRNYKNIMFSKMFMNKLRNKWVGDIKNNEGDAAKESTASDTNLKKVNDKHTSQRKSKRCRKNPGVHIEAKSENKNCSESNYSCQF